MYDQGAPQKLKFRKLQHTVRPRTATTAQHFFLCVCLRFPLQNSCSLSHSRHFFKYKFTRSKLYIRTHQHHLAVCLIMVLSTKGTICTKHWGLSLTQRSLTAWCPGKWQKSVLWLFKKTNKKKAQVQIYSRHIVHAIIFHTTARNCLLWPGLKWSHWTSTSKR